MPAAHNSPGFVSFSNYLDANAGSLDAERNQALAAASAAGDKAQGDLTGLYKDSLGAGKDAAIAAGPQDRDKPASAPGFDPTTLSGYAPFLTDRQAALDAASSLNDPSQAAGKFSPWESGLIDASNAYQDSAKGLQSKYGTALNDYLGTLGVGFDLGYGRNIQYKPPVDMGPGGDSYNAGYDDSGPRDPGAYGKQYGNGPSNPNPTPGSTDDSGVDRSGQPAPTQQTPTNGEDDPYSGTWGGGG